MKERTLIGNLHDVIGNIVMINGWIDVRRDHGKLIFLIIRDRTGYIQAVALPNHGDVVAEASKLRPEFVVSIKGQVNKRPDKMIKTEESNGDIELEILSIETLSVAQELPFDKEATLNIDTLLDYRPLTVRRERERAIFHVQHEIVQAYRDFLVLQDFVEFQAPKIVGDDAEGGSNVFKIAYLKDKDAYLATSPQLYKQIMVGAFERVFSIGNVFRAELHSTTRHLNEYTSLDIEMGYIKDHTDIMALEEALMRFLVHRLAERCEKEFVLLNATMPILPDTTFPSMKLREAQELIYKETGLDKHSEPDLEPEDERFLCEYAHEKMNSDFIFVTHYPVSKRPFYIYEDEQDKGFTKSFDLLYRGVEVTTGGQRVHDHAMLVEKMKAKGLNPENFSFYLQAFKYGLPPHGGWGMGLERLTQKFLNLNNVKEATLFPREINRIDTLLSQ